MSIQITVRHSDGTQQNLTLNNGEGEINTKTEAEDALTFAPNDGDTIDVGGKSYTRQQLMDIRDGKSGGAPKSSGDKSFDFSGNGSPRVGKWGHNTGEIQGAYGKLIKDGNETDVWAKIGGQFGGGLWNFKTPGGEAAQSLFGGIGINGELALDINPKGGKGHIGLGAEGSVSGFSSPKDTIVELPQDCTPDDFGQGECEPDAGPITGNNGTSGVYNPFQHNSVHGAGVAISGALKLSLGVDVAPKTRINVSVAPTVTYLADRNPFGFFGVNFGGGVTYLFGKVAAPTPPPTNPGATSDGAPIDETGTPKAAGTAFDPTALIAGLPQGVRLTRIEMTNDATKAVEANLTSPPWLIPADKMTNGDHTIRIYYSLPGGAGEKFREVKVRVGAAPIVVASTDNGSAYGLVLDMPATASRLAPDMVGGIATPRPIPLGSIQTLAGFPAGTKYQLYVDGNPVGALTDLPPDRRTELTLPATVDDGPHQVELRVSRPGQPEVRFPARAVNVRPSVATLTNVSIVTPPTTYKSDPIRLNLTTTKATKAKVTITDPKGRSTALDVDIPATIPAGGIIIVPQGVAKTLPVKGLCTFSITPEGGTATAVIGSVTISGKVPATGNAGGGGGVPILR